MEPLLVARTIACALFAICFLQSGMDKIVDWKGNLDWLTGHFSKSFLAGTVPLLLGVITAMEIVTSLACAFAIVVLWTSGQLEVPTAAMALSCTTLLMLFTGQRFAKDYVGAATLATYFAVALLGLISMHTWPG